MFKNYNRTSYSRGYCTLCGMQRDSEGETIHDFHCVYFAAVDLDFINDDGDRVKIFTPYIPEGMIK